MRHVNTTNGLTTDVVGTADETGRAGYGSNLIDPTLINYGTYSFAYDYLNKVLFGGELPPCLLTLQRRRGAAGYYDHLRFEAHDGSHRVSEIASNPSCAAPYVTAADRLSTMAHEQCHLWQAYFGKPGRDRYHNRQWATKMLSVGLVPSTTGLPGGRQTGRRISHFIREGGPFDLACAALLKSGFTFPYEEVHDGAPDPRAVRRKLSRAASKTPYTCPSCFPRVQTWGRPKLQLICKPCGSDLVAEDGDEANWIDGLKDDQ